MVEAGASDRPCGIRDYAALLCGAMPPGAAQLRHVHVPPRGVTRNHWRAMAEARRRVRAEARGLPPSDLIHAHYADFSWNGVRSFEDCYECFVRACDRPVVVTLHEHPWFRGRHLWDRPRTPADLVFACLARQWPFTRSLPARLLVRHAAIHVHHAWQRDMLVAQGVSAARIITLPHFVPDCPATPAAAMAFRKRFGLETQRILAMTGFVFERKRHDRALAVLPRLPNDVVLCLVGGANGPVAERYVGQLKEQARRLNVVERFIITGYLPEPEMNAALLAADAFVAPYGEVSSSASVARCIAAGAPIVASQCPTFAELAADGAGVMPVDPEDAEALSRALMMALSRSDEAALLRKSNAGYAATWSIRAVVGRLQDWYGAVMNGPPRRVS